ncbi:S-layer homology domain-containing protein [Intestinimonas butyriciproducens]|uniref:S-layer homology domain-containing protein n=1 Tax=Intestinimonas butyriciproducens TaxID=1297617 RepID=UPI00321949E0
MKKKLLSLLLVLVMVLGMFPMGAMAAENTLAVTNVMYKMSGEENWVVPVKLKNAVTVTNGNNSVTPGNMYYLEIEGNNEDINQFILCTSMIDFMGNIKGEPKSGGSEYSYMGTDNMKDILLDDSTTFTGLEKVDGCTYYFATSLNSSQQFDNKLGIIICVNPNSGSQEPENSAPALVNGVSAAATKEIEAGSAYTVDLSTIFTDADNDTLTYTIAIDGEGSEATSKDYSKTFDTAGDYTLVFTATDGKASVTYTVSLTVKETGGSQEPESTLAVTGVTYNGDKSATVSKLDGSVTVGEITPQNVYLVEINETLNTGSNAKVIIQTNESAQLYDSALTTGTAAGTEHNVYVDEQLNQKALVDENTAITDFEKEDGCTYYFLVSGYLDENIGPFGKEVCDNKLGIIICVNPNGGSQEPENTLAVTGVTYNNGKSATVTKLVDSITVNVPKVGPFSPAKTITPQNVYLVEINEALTAEDIVIETSEEMQLGSVFGDGFKYDLGTEFTLTSEYRDEYYLIPGENNVTVTGFEMEDGCTYYFLTSASFAMFEDPVFDNKLGILICVKPVAVNHAPTLAPGIYTNVTDEQAVNTPYTLDLSTIFTDADGDELTYTVAIGEGNAEAASENYSKTFDTTGDYTLVFTASDGKASVTYTVTVTVYDLTAVDITTQEELTEFMTNAREGQVGTLKNDLVLRNWKSYDEEWGDALFKFRGTLDGAGHTITIDSTCHTLCLENQGIIKNLTLAGELEISNLSRGNFCTQNRGTITNCKNTIAIVNTGDNINPKGGICAINYGEISNCYNTASITGRFVGGIAGENLGTIENCFNTGLITAEYYAGGIVYQNHVGTVKNCYNFGLMHHYEGWDSFYGSYIEKELGPIIGDNMNTTFNVGSGLGVNSEGTAENNSYLDAYALYKAYGSTLTAELSDLYLTEKIVAPDWNARPVHAICGWKIPNNQTVFAENTTYYGYYDASNDHFIVVQKDASAESNVVDALNPGTECVVGESAGGETREFYLVKVPADAATVAFKNTEQIVNYSLGYTNEYLNANQLLDHAGVSYGANCSEKFVGTAITGTSRDAVLTAVETICGNDTETAAYVEKLLGGVKKESNAEPDTPSNPGENNKIDVTFRLVGATLSTSGNYDLGANPPVKDSEYVTWIATKSYTVDKNTTAGELLVMALNDAGMRADGIENNYIANVYAPSVLGSYYLAEFTNGVRSGWMYSINGKHPDIGVNGYFLKDGDAMIFHYINDYSYECSDWFNDREYPNLGDASTWDPWLKVADKNPTKDTPTVGVGGADKAPEEVTVPISGDENTIHVGATVEGTKATIDEVDLTDLNKVVGDQVDTGTVTIDFSGLESDEAITTVELPADTVKKIAEAVNDPKNDAHSLEIVLSDGASIEFDAAALKEKASQANGADITISIESHENVTLTNAQKKALGDRPAYDINVTSGGKHISDMGGKITVHAPYVLKGNEKARGIVVWYVDDNGNKERCVTSYDPIKKRVNWKTDHLSLYMIDYDETLANNPFTDVTMDNYYFDAVLWAVDEGITVGTSDTTFSPDASCTRAQMVTFLWRAAGSPKASVSTCAFTDVDKDAYYYEALLWAVENGITSGTSATTFSPNASCTRGQMATFLYRDAKSPAVTGTHAFTDVKADAYYNDAVIWAAAEGITVGTSDTTFSPDADCTRGQMVTFLYRYLAE